jgi:Berberine and berberine like
VPVPATEADASVGATGIEPARAKYDPQNLFRVNQNIPPAHVTT